MSEEAQMRRAQDLRAQIEKISQPSGRSMSKSPNEFIRQRMAELDSQEGKTSDRPSPKKSRAEK